tara:strand:- start:55 stop:480 length:426 start_codon:yes stop_codon:yes gene_type:complete
MNFLNKCFFCGRPHVDYGSRTPIVANRLAQKTSFEVLIILLKDLKKFIDINKAEPTVWECVSCFCRFSIFSADEQYHGKTNQYSKIHYIAFEGILRLLLNKSTVLTVTEFIDKMCFKLWEEHENLLAAINQDVSKRLNSAR